MNRTARLAQIIPSAIVAAVAFYISANDVVHTAMEHGKPFHVAIGYPVVLDAGLLSCALILIASRGVSRITKLYAKVGRSFCAAATLYANALSAPTFDVHDVAVSVAPAVVLIIVVEATIHAFKGTAQSRTSRPAVKSGNVTPIRSRRTP